MSTVLTARTGPSSAALPGVNLYVVAVTVTLATFMEVLDTSVANVSLPYIAGDLGVSQDEASWVLTTYLVANAVVLPISGWASNLIGRKRFYMTCVAVFTVSSILCGLAPSLGWLLLFRVLQGAGGGGLQPSEQGILLDTFPGEKRGMGMAIYGVAVLVAPILGPTLGGYVTENYDWRWIFYINVPVGVLSLFLTSIIVRDPPYLVEARKKRRGLDIDYIGLGLIALGLGSLEIVYDRGQIDDWFGSRFITILIVVAAVCIVSAIVWELIHPHPIVNLRLLKDRNFAVGCLIMYCTFAVLYGSTILLPQMLQSLYGYDAFTAGLVLSPGGIATMIGMPVAGYLLGKRVDARVLIFIGLLAVAGATYWNSLLNLFVSADVVVIRRCAQVVGMAFIFAPINTAAYIYIPEKEHNNATALFNMVRNEGASLGIALVTILVDRRSQFHQARISDHFNVLSPNFQAAWDRTTQLFQGSGFDATTARDMGLGELYRQVQQQALALSYFDVFWLFAIAGFLVVPLVFFMRRSVSEKGAAGGMH